MGQRRRLGRGTSAQSLFHRLSETSTPTVVFVLLMFGVFAPHRRRSFKGAAVSSTSSTSSSTFLAVFSAPSLYNTRKILSTCFLAFIYALYFPLRPTDRRKTERATHFRAPRRPSGSYSPSSRGAYARHPASCSRIIAERREREAANGRAPRLLRGHSRPGDATKTSSHRPVVPVVSGARDRVRCAAG